MHIAEGLVARRQGDEVGGGVEAVHIGAQPDERHAIAESEPDRLRTVRSVIPPAGHDQARATIADGREPVHQRSQPLALEARPDEEHAPVGRVHAELGPHRGPV